MLVPYTDILWGSYNSAFHLLEFLSKRKLKMQLTVTLLLAVAVPLANSAAVYERLNNAIGRTPAMGWNSWVRSLMNCRAP
jgi:hypothetical protein